jgi:2'-5' RNA ligase
VSIIRSFIAIERPAEIRAYFHQIGRFMSSNIPQGAVRWVAPDNIHLTLRFLGDTPEDKLPFVSAALDTIAVRYTPVSLHLDQVGCFPNRKRPRVIWVGLAGDLQFLNALQTEVEKAVQSLGWPAEGRPFRAHLTIGRVKDSSQAARLLWNQSLEKKEVPVSAVHLIESRLTPTGPIYTTRHSSSLTRQPA